MMINNKRLKYFLLYSSYYLFTNLAQADKLNTEVNFTQRSRYEHLDRSFRSVQAEHDHGFYFRSHLDLKLGWSNFNTKFEFVDSRQVAAKNDSPIGTGHVNALEVVQAQLSYQLDHLFSNYDKLDIQLGRTTLDIDSRRVVARNRYRNTLNNFNGIMMDYHNKHDHLHKVFYFIPIQRLPSRQSEALDNRVRNDREATNINFSGWTGTYPFTSIRSSLSTYFFRLNEKDDQRQATSNRRLSTIGFRLKQKPQKKLFDFELESYYQWGKSRASRSADDTVDLNHQAYFAHFELGYQFESSSPIRLAFQFDLASGDRNPNDGENNRFDTLYGARRFDFGPTGLYGPFARSNLITPGLRLSYKPNHKTEIMLSHRAYWLANRHDTWTTTGLRDTSGQSGKALGQQPEIRLRYQLIPQKLKLESGLALLFRDDFESNTRNQSTPSTSNYFYTQTSLFF